MEPDDIGAVEQRLVSDAALASDYKHNYAVVALTDLTSILREFEVLRRSYNDRGAVIARLAGEFWQERGIGR